SGKGYVGLRIWGYYREYIQVKLNEPLRPGEKYSLKFYVAISPWCNSVAGEIGACLTEKAQSLANNSVISMKPQVQRFFDRTCKDSLSWMLVSDTFTAKGGEKFLSLGYFGKKEKTKLIKKKVLHMTLVREAYYYVDDVSLFRFDAEGKDITAPQPLTREELKKIPIDTLQAGNYLEKQVKQDSSIVMKNIFFASGRSDLLPESFEELGLLVDLLNSDPGLEIEIVGHTDNTGNEEENKKLSFHRAEAVVKYLVDNGIAPQRLTCSGKGSDEPLSTNDTEEGKQQNRRVEFRVVKK
ncbi:MAG TPA: OmpA family protein, partial [Bacteroidia bacterium]